MVRLWSICEATGRSARHEQERSGRSYFGVLEVGQVMEIEIGFWGDEVGTAPWLPIFGCGRDTIVSYQLMKRYSFTQTNVLGSFGCARAPPAQTLW